MFTNCILLYDFIHHHRLLVGIGSSDVIMVSNVLIDIIFVMVGDIALMVVMNGRETILQCSGSNIKPSVTDVTKSFASWG